MACKKLAPVLGDIEDDYEDKPVSYTHLDVYKRQGMEGATGIDVSMLKGKKLLNMDSEEEGVMLASCAGGCRACLLYTSTGRNKKIMVGKCLQGFKSSICITGSGHGCY